VTARPILTLENPVLRTRAARVRSFTGELQTLVADMIETMHAAPGVGLAAPQVGVRQRVIVVEYTEESEDEPGPALTPPPTPVGGTKPLPKLGDTRPQRTHLYVVVNPEIVRRSPETSLGNEGCLSIPGFFGEVERAERVTVRGLNRRGDPFQVKAEGWLARIFQHEIDHLDGVLFIDRAKEVWRVEDETGEGEIEGRGSSQAV
jgi:peptide deformylase